MLLRCLCVLGGAYALGLWRALPSSDLLLPVGFLAAACFYWPRFRALACFITGFTTMWIGAWLVIDDRLASQFRGQTLAIDVQIVDFPEQRDESLRLVVTPHAESRLPARIRLSWHRPTDQPQIGETWHLRVRLRRPHAYANPDGFDFEGFLFREGIGATGYVVSHDGNRRLDGVAVQKLAAIRRSLATRLTSLLPDDDATAVLLAIGVGARHRITPEQWDRYAVSGTSHLMAISGLHVGLAAGGVMFLAWAMFAVCLPRRNIRDLALVVALLAAVAYVAVSGAAVPAMRALIMALLAAGAVLCRLRPDPVRLLCLPALVLFFANPVSIHAPGFKLSFAAVAIILWRLRLFERPGAQHQRLAWPAIAGNLLRLAKLQLALLAGLFPLTVLIFGRFSVLAPLSNLLILPVFNFVTVPFCLLGMLLGGPLQFLGDLLLVISHASVRLVLDVVVFLSDLPGLRIATYPMSGVLLAISVLPACHVLLPPGWPGRKLAFVAILVILLQRPPQTPAGCLDYHVLDVGQGLAVLLRAGSHTLLFDTGPAFRSGGSAASLAIVPFLESRGIEHLDTLVISHADQDHAGGIDDIVRRFKVNKVLVGEFVPALNRAQRRCDPDRSYVAQGIRFRFVHPSAGLSWQGNNASCVLEVVTGQHRLLLTGDIEKPVETALLASGALRQVAAVVVPHHGSSTSSSAALVGTLKPDLAIVSAGFDNRWGFPRKEVRTRWAAVGTVLLETAMDGAVSQRICRDSGAGAIRRERRESRHYWHDEADPQR